MAILDRLLPGWRHSDPSVRAEAVRKLGKDSRDILASIARGDSDARVRHIAIKKIDDAELLLEIAQSDADDDLRAVASAQAEELLVERALSRQPPEDCARALARLTRDSHRATVALRAFHPSLRSAALSAVSEQRPLAEIARRSDDPQIAFAALERVTDAALLRRIAAGEARPEVAVAALARVEDPALLQAIVEDAQAQKGVRKRARAMLDRLLTEDHPIRVAERRARQAQLCAAVERLIGALDPATDVAVLRQAEHEWVDLSARTAPAPEVETRFRRACEALAKAIARAEDRSAEERKREAVRLQAYAVRRQLCETVEALEGPETPGRLDEARAAWRAVGESDDPRCHQLAARFALAVERCEQRHERWRVRDAFRSRLETLVVEAEGLVAAGDPRAAGRPWATLERRWEQLASSPEGTKWLVNERTLHRRFVEAGDALKHHEQAARAERRQREKEARGTLEALCARVEQLAGAETLRRSVAERALAAAAAAPRQLQEVPAAEREVLRQRLTAAQQTLAHRVEEQATAEGWKRWANADVQQQLIARAEALLAADDPREMLRQIGQLEQAWTQVATAPHDLSQSLWDRFRRARDELRRRGDAHLSENLAKKEALCAAVEQLAESTDWNATAETIRRMQAEWKEIGPVRQQISAALFERFRAPANRFFERRKQFLVDRKQQRDELLGRMQKLCEAAEALADSTDWETTAAAVKRLQGEAQQVWRRRRAPVPAQGETPRQTEVLHTRFRAACDRFFDRYRRRDAIALEVTLAAAETILGDLDALRESVAAAGAPTPEEVTRRLKDDLAEWGRLGAIPPDHARALQQRMEAACNAIEAACPDGLIENELAAESNTQQREKLCLRLERLVTSLPADTGGSQPTDLAERLKLALAANTIGGPAATRREQAVREALETAARLREKWQRLGPIVGQRARALALRFDKAAADLEMRCGAQPSEGQSAR